MLGKLFTFGSSFLVVLNQGPEESHMGLLCCAIKCVFVCVCVYLRWSFRGFGVLWRLYFSRQLHSVVWESGQSQFRLFCCAVVCMCVCALWSLRFTLVLWSFPSMSFKGPLNVVIFGIWSDFHSWMHWCSFRASILEQSMRPPARPASGYPLILQNLAIIGRQVLESHVRKSWLSYMCSTRKIEDFTFIEGMFSTIILTTSIRV